jgi:hypothetical protein
MSSDGRTPEPESVDFGPVLAVADAVLWEGYLLYPYRRSSAKNRVRWQFGVLAPRAWIEARGAPDDGVAGSAESWWNRTECLLEARPETTVELLLRYLELTPGETEGGLDEGSAREVPVRFRLGDVRDDPLVVHFERPAGRLEVAAEWLGPRGSLHKLTVRVENMAEADPAAARDEVLRQSLVATHVLLGTARGAFLSLVDPPEWARAAAEGCHSVRTFPVLAGPPGTTSLVLSSPIILYDHPQVAPESPGDLFDAVEIDEILSLRMLTLTDEEKAEARATDGRAAEILDRTEGLPPEVMARLHGAVRSLRPVGRAPEEPAAYAAGLRLDKGTRVVLRPRNRGTDAQDMFLAGRTATVEEVLEDVEGERFVVVALEGDPRAAIEGGPGRFRHFSPDELVPAAEAGAP